jgi:predicted esterase
MPWSLSLQGVRRTTNESNIIITKKLGDNSKIYEPASHPLGSLILLMGMGAELSWTMTQWWYLDPAWHPSNREWCKGDCTFDDEDKAAVQKLRNHMRVVDAVGMNTCSIGKAWYNYDYTAGSWPDAPPIAHELEEAVANVFALIEHERSIVGSYDRIAIAGMSQGADLALEVGIRFPHRLGMVMSERGMLLQSRMQGTGLAAGPGTPFILTAVEKDDATTPSNVKKSCASLLPTQTPVNFKLYHGPEHHGSFWKAEWKLSIKAFSLMMLGSVSTAPQIALLTQWDSCQFR